MHDPRDLVGRWRLDRVVEDRRSGERHEIDGTLEITPDDEGLRWEETLVWHRPDAEVDVRRRLLLRSTDAGWWVRFEDDRDFHPWRPGETVVHDCAPDTYLGDVTGGPERWSVRWRVTGPVKDYTMTSTMTRR